MQQKFGRSVSNNALEALPDAIRNEIYRIGTVREYNPGDSIIPPGDCGRRIGFLLSGEAIVHLRDAEDNEISVDSLRPGDLFGEISFLTGSPSPSDSELSARDHCKVLEINSEEFEGIIENNPDLLSMLVKNLARKIMRLDRLVFDNKQKRRGLQTLIGNQNYVFPDYVTGDYINTYVMPKAKRLADSDGPILITGEPGVGKEVLAHSIFKMSPQFNGVFLLLDLLRTRSEPSGHSGGSGNHSGKSQEEERRLFFGSQEMSADGEIKKSPGYIELTEDGTLLVRNVEKLSAETQGLLIPVLGLDSGEPNIPRRQPKFRLIATTELDETKFSQERYPLLHALRHRSVGIPPLRKRRREIPALVDHYSHKYCEELGKQTVTLPKETLRILVNYNWPGNDIELSTTLKRAVLVSEGGILKPQDIYFDLKRVEGAGKLNLLSFRLVKQALLSPLFPAVFQSAVTPFFFILLVLLFLGPSDPMRNPAALFAWSLGWPILIAGAFLWARFWCSLCPIGTMSKLAKKIISFEKPFPAVFKNHSDKFIAAAVLCIIWFETATGIRNSPFNVGLLLLTMLLSATTISVIFERQSWCRYLCGLGGMISVLSKASPLELRADRNVCISQCSSNECYLGTPDREGCPFGIVAPKLHSNRFCKICGICIKICPHDAVNLNLRMPGKEIWEIRHTNTGTAFLIIGMIGGILAEMISKTPYYRAITEPLPFPEIVKFTVAFVMLLLGVNLLLLMSAYISHRVFSDSFEENYSRFGLALLPIALTGFMAFHFYYLINLGVQLPILISENFHFEIFKQLVIKVPPWVVHSMQNFLIWAGLAWTVFIMYRIGQAGSEKRTISLAGILPHVAVAAFLAVFLREAIKFFFYPA